MDAATTPSSARQTLLVLVLVAAALTAWAIVQRDRALDRAYEDAQSDAEGYASSTIAGALIPSDLTGPIEGPRADLVRQDIQRVVDDPAVARVRVWGADGTLLFTTAARDRPGAGGDPPIQDVLGGVSITRRTVDRVSIGTEPGPVDVPILQTFAPLQLRGMTEPGAVVEIDQFASELEERADDPWGPVVLGGSVATGVLGLLALVALIRSRGNGAHTRRVRRETGFGGSDAIDVSSDLERAVARARESEATAAAYAAQLQQASSRLEILEASTPDERMEELREALRRSEAERAMLRAGRPETMIEAEMRQLRRDLQDARSRAKAAEALAAGKGDLTAVQEQLSAAEHQVELAAERAKIAEGRAQMAEEQARATGELAGAAEQRIDLLEAKLQEVASAGALAAQDESELVALRDEVLAANERVSSLERRAADAEARAALLAESASAGAITEDVLQGLEERVASAEAKAAEAEQRLRAFEDEAVEHGSSFRHTLGVRAAGRKLAAPEPAPVEEAELDPGATLRSAIARGLRGPLTRAAGLTLSLQGSVASGEGKRVLRELSSALRRLDQLAADLHDVQRIEDGTLPLTRRRTDVTALLTTTLEEADQLQEDRLVRLDAERLHATTDPVRLRQVVEGMLEGARDRTRTGAAIVVRARGTESGVRISVEDDNRTPAVVGPEMDLAARLAELMGTELVANGSSYSIVLPADDA